MKKSKGFIGRVFFSLVMIVEVAIIAISISSKASNKTPSFFGISTYVIITGSMSPEIEVGDVIVTYNVKDKSKISVGDVITYKGEVGSYANKTITHKVESIREDNGKYYFITKGVANSESDPEISEDQIVGKMLFKSYVLSFLFGILSSTYGFLALIMVPIIYIIINGIINICKELKEERIQKIKEALEKKE